MSAALQIPMSDYIQDQVGAPVPTLNSGVAHRLISRSPLHAWTRHPKLNPAYESETSEAFDLGAAVHAVFLEGNEGILAVGDFPNWRTKASQDFRDWARSEGKIPLLIEQADVVQRMARRASTAVALSPDLDGIGALDAEQTFVWQHEGTWLRCRPDLTARDGSIVLSYKTTSSPAEPNAFARQVVNYGYHMQAAFEIAAHKALFRRTPRYVWVTQEVTEPYAVSLTSLSPAFLDFAFSQFEYAVSLWKSCLDSGQWPGYDDRIAYLDPPAWVVNEWEWSQAS